MPSRGKVTTWSTWARMPIHSPSAVLTTTLLNMCWRKHTVANEVCYKTGSRPVIQSIGFVPLVQLALLHHANLVADGKGL